MIKKLITLGMAILMIFGLSACYEYPYYVSYKADKTEFDIDDVTIEFFYGVNLSWAINYGDPTLLFFASDRIADELLQEVLDFDNDPNLFFIKKIDADEFYSSKYAVKLRGDNLKKANHSEKITIPKEVFNKEAGNVYFYMKPDADSGYVWTMFALDIPYELNGDKVILTMTENFVAFL